MSYGLDTEEDLVLAAEYALRLLDGEEAKAAANRAAIDPLFAAEVAAWQARFAPLADKIKPVTPSRQTRNHLQSRIFGQRPTSSVNWSAILWRAATLISLAAVAILLVDKFQRPDVPPLFVTELEANDGSVRVLAVYDSVTGFVRMRRTNGTAESGRDFQVWAQTTSGRPISIGVLPDAQQSVGFPLPANLADTLPNVTLSISDEPDGGSTTGAPSGPIIATGAIDAI